MADFGEICPLFSTGVFHEVTFPELRLTDITSSGNANALIGTLTFERTAPWVFGRTVIVTNAYIRRKELPSVDATCVLLLRNHTTQLAVGSVFASLSIGTYVGTSVEVASWVPMTITAERTFTSSEVLGLAVLTGTANGGGTFDLMIRYKEK